MLMCPLPTIRQCSSATTHHDITSHRVLVLSPTCQPAFSGIIAVVNAFLFVAFTPNVFPKFGVKGFTWVLIYIMLPWMSLKFLAALCFSCSRQKLNKSSTLARLQQPAPVAALPMAAAPTTGLFAQMPQEASLMIFVPVWRESDSQLRRTLMVLE